jgi:hypothetical protein
VKIMSIIAMVLLSTCAVRAQEPHIEATSTEHSHQNGALELFPARDASGTSWLPDDTPMHGIVRAWGGWSVMLHGNAFAQFLYEPGDRHRTGGFSTRQFGSINWGMAGARRYVGDARVGVRGMVSLEPWTIPGCGYLSFLATGEICEGDTIHDRQHPHDFFMELAADYDRPLRGGTRWQIYAGLAGEPALGPAGFPHRSSALPNPIAPIAHHWLDATHITFGLVTASVYDRRWKTELSIFNGREPDENRGDLDLGPLDSVSGRVTLLPNRRLALQISAGHLRDAEAGLADQPRTSVTRATASATYHRTSPERLWATTVAYGVNASREVVVVDVLDAATQAALIETSLTIRDRDTWFGRAEIAEMPAHDLHAHEYPVAIFTIGKIQAGYVRHLRRWRGVVAGIGGTVAASLVPPRLVSRYGGRVSPSVGLFINLRPGSHSM